MPLTLTCERVEETRARYVYPRPITIDEWLEDSYGDVITDLVNGAPTEQPTVPLDHAKLHLWLLNVLAVYARRAEIGTVLGLRCPVHISQFGGRLPDLFFVRREREHLITSKATLGTPDMILEIVSPNDRRADINATEADYRTVGVAEIVYIDQPRQRIRVLRKMETGYEEEPLSGQPLTFRSMGGLTLEWDWLFVEPRPDIIDTVLALRAMRSA